MLADVCDHVGPGFASESANRLAPANQAHGLLGLRFGRWVVLVYDYEAAGAMTDAERASWAATFSGRETDGGFLLLEGSGPAPARARRRTRGSGAHLLGR